MVDKVESPCLRNCCLDKKDVCIGCGRTLNEIKGWQAATKSEKIDILEKSAKRIKPLSFK
ncbi:MAG: DUF1289 domain-containing protein [Gammaproteobacteria bacterium]|nr:DUF1289 domain-containing protein [Gammaproteobacteria bacterium]